MEPQSKRPKLSDVLYVDLLEQIRDRRLAPDDRLPSEHQLAERFRVSRPIVREALRRLREEGVLVSRQGAGSFVSRAFAPASPGAAARPMMGDAPPLLKSIADIQRFYTYRIVLEGAIAAEAAVHADEAAMAEIDRATQGIEAAMQGGVAAVYEDFEFHLSIARATRNPFFVTALQAIHPAMQYVIDLALSLTGRDPEKHDLLVLQDHRVVVEAIRRRDATAAGEAMRQHIQRAHDRVFLGIEPPMAG